MSLPAALVTFGLAYLLGMFAGLSAAHDEPTAECETAEAAIAERLLVLEVRIDRLTELQRRYQSCGDPHTAQWSECMERE